MFHVADERGAFSKPYSYAFGKVPFVIRELFWSASARGAVRGMHTQLPPAAAAKLVWVSYGEIVDVLVDIRCGDTYGAVQEYRLSAAQGGALYIPAGFAHGFQALTDGAVVNYAQDHEFAPKCDAGINWRSIDHTWPLEPTVTSARDDALPSLADFDSPFERTDS
ncbi:MAG: dTDP-4-dehydrorhamnose 3,5-epimerase [Cellulomonadaceae bacterium]|jgi:dTDP-4-dehydrorhamnose 3,5-epimerase|nr:dTDP-4-dehydrorhamnose 3,5-epimerase [Cellulomonadaceae bacterium]